MQGISLGSKVLLLSQGGPCALEFYVLLCESNVFLIILSSRLTHKLKFESHTPALAKDASTKTDDWFEIYDPRNPINKRRRETSRDIMKSREKR
jgi:hypothetical protein